MDENKENPGLSLLDKGKKGFFSVIFSRFGLILLLLLVQVLVLFAMFRWFEEWVPHIYGGTMVLTVGMMLYVLNTQTDASAKLTWLVIILLLPVFGGLLYLYTRLDIGHRALKSRVNQLADEAGSKLMQDMNVIKDLENENPGAACLARYINKTGCYPVYNDSDVTYFPIGEDKFRQLLIELKQAKHFIFMEYFIVREGLMWGQILEILAQKVKEGVEVRVMYDGTCEFAALPHSYPQKMKELGIQCKAFAPLSPFVSTHYNYRDHRKILVIDGSTAFTGGVNLADEYINKQVRFGHWKDTAVMVKGEAVQAFTLMFLQLWSIDEKRVTYSPYLNPPAEPYKADGFVIPYGDCPLDSDKVGEEVYIDLLNRATRYVHIMTPYLILDGETENALCFAAQRGVDVRLILPGIPDKFVPFSLAFTHYRSLLAAGVKIYEYTPGFVHAKSFVVDDREAVVGTINLDYRSLYHHFECATYMYRSRCIPDIEEDFRKTQAKCRRITPQSMHKEKLSRKVIGFLVKPLAPLL